MLRFRDEKCWNSIKFEEENHKFSFTSPDLELPSKYERRDVNEVVG